MPRIVVHAPAGLLHLYSGFRAPEPGEYDFPDDPRFAEWLQGYADRGKVTILPSAPSASDEDGLEAAGAEAEEETQSAEEETQSAEGEPEPAPLPDSPGESPKPRRGRPPKAAQVAKESG